MKPEPESAFFRPIPVKTEPAAEDRKRSRDGGSPIPEAPAGWVEDEGEKRRKKEARESARRGREAKRGEN